MSAKVFHIGMSALRSEFLTAAKHGASKLTLTNHRNYRVVESIMEMDKSFTGASISEFVGYLENGYDVPGLEIDSSAMPVRKRKRPRYNDCEGDFRYDLFVSGDDNCFMEWSRREAVAGIHVQFFLGFTAVTPADVIGEYCSWILSALTTLEANGVDCSVSAFNRGRGRTENYRSDDEFHIEVKREGERNDFTDWSAILSPGAYRILGFFTLALAADSRNEICSGGFGGSTGDKWGVSFNAEKRVIEISADSNGRSFPAERMTMELGAAIAAARGE